MIRWPGNVWCVVSDMHLPALTVVVGLAHLKQNSRCDWLACEDDDYVRNSGAKGTTSVLFARSTRETSLLYVVNGGRRQTFAQ